jgi:hypothetical protein
MVLGSLPKCNKRYKLDVFHGLDGFSVWHWLYTSMRVSWGASGVTPGDMEKNFMKNRFAAKANKGFLEIAIGLLAICLSGVFFGGFASADDAAGDVDGSISTTTSELDTQEQCTWFVTGVPATVVMIRCSYRLHIRKRRHWKCRWEYGVYFLQRQDWNHNLEVNQCLCIHR